MTDARLLSVAVRTTGPDARLHGLFELAAVWVAGGPAEDSFSAAFDPFPGALRDEETMRRHGPGVPCADWDTIEPEAWAEFRWWAGLDRAPALLCGLRPSMVRAFLLAAARRASADRLGNPPAPGIPARVVDLHTLFLAARLAAGAPVPGAGFRHYEVYAGMGMAVPAPDATALEIARAEAELAWRLLP